MTYSLDLRKKVLDIKEKQNLSLTKVAEKFQISRNTIFKWTKNIFPKKTKNKKPHKITNEALIEDVKKFPDSYQHERAKRLGVSKTGIQEALKRLKITYKKNSKTPKSERRRTLFISEKN